MFYMFKKYLKIKNLRKHPLFDFGQNQLPKIVTNMMSQCMKVSTKEGSRHIKLHLQKNCNERLCLKMEHNAGHQETKEQSGELPHKAATTEY